MERDNKGRFFKGGNLGHKPFGGFNTRFQKGHIDLVPKSSRGHTEETKEKIGLSSIGKHAGELAWNWKGGISYGYRTGYYSTEYKEWRKSVFERDDFCCQECGWRGYITAHHIKSFAHYPELRFDINNGITLCEYCHSLTDNYKGRNKGKGSLLLTKV